MTQKKDYKKFLPIILITFLTFFACEENVKHVGQTPTLDTLESMYKTEEVFYPGVIDTVTPINQETQTPIPTLTVTTQLTSMPKYEDLVNFESINLACGFPCQLGLMIGKSTRRDVIDLLEGNDQDYMEGERCAPFCSIQTIYAQHEYDIYFWFYFTSDDILTQLITRIYPYENVEKVINFWPERILVDYELSWIKLGVIPSTNEDGIFSYWMVMGFDDMNTAIHYSASSSLIDNGYLNICPTFTNTERGLDWLELYYYPTVELMHSREGLQGDDRNLQVNGVNVNEIFICEGDFCEIQCAEVEIDPYSQE